MISFYFVLFFSVDVTAHQASALIAINSVTSNAPKPLTPTLLLVVPQGGTVHGIQIRWRVTAKVKCIFRKFIKSTGLPRNVAVLISVGPRVAYKIAKIHMPHFPFLITWFVPMHLLLGRVIISLT